MPAEPHNPVQRVVKIRRDYNTWVANETMEDYALRFTPRSFRKWSELRVANTAFGAASFLVLEAVGATMLVDAGFINAFWAILATGLLIFLLGNLVGIAGGLLHGVIQLFANVGRQAVPEFLVGDDGITQVAMLGQGKVLLHFVICRYLN